MHSLHKTTLILLALFVFLTGTSASPVLWQTEQEGEFFEETGHSVSGPFLAFFLSAPDPLLLFGYPITEALDHPIKQGFKVQYFQRAKMEWDVLSPTGVTLAPLGEYLYDSLQHGERANFPINNGACRLFATGKPVCYAFLQFYDSHQGSKYFGEPISDVEILDNRLVQYFTYGRMEWRPENEPGKRVALTDIGRLDFDITIGDTNAIDPRFIGPFRPLPTQLQVFAFTDRPLVADGERQTIFVIVRDQLKEPVENALVMVSVISPDGRVDNYRPEGVTNEDGVIKIDFEVKDLKPNQIIHVIARVNVVDGPMGVAETMFRVWW